MFGILNMNGIVNSVIVNREVDVRSSRLMSIVSTVLDPIRLFRLFLLLLYGLQNSKVSRWINPHWLFPMFNALHANKNSSGPTD